MRTSWLVLVAILVGAPCALLLAHASGQGPGGTLSAGETLQIEVVDTDTLGIVAGLVTLHRTGPLGLELGTTTADAGGWVVLAPPNVDVVTAQTVAVTDDLAFTDPNGATWLARQLDIDGHAAWAVPVGHTLYEPTLGTDYNWALVVDWNDVPEGLELSATFVDELPLR